MKDRRETDGGLRRWCHPKRVTARREALRHEARQGLLKVTVDRDGLVPRGVGPESGECAIRTGGRTKRWVERTVRRAVHPWADLLRGRTCHSISSRRRHW